MKRKVTEVFQQPDHLLLLPFNVDPQSVIRQFDQPEKLALVEVGVTLAICLKTTKQRIEILRRRVKQKLEKLERQGEIPNMLGLKELKELEAQVYQEIIEEERISDY